MIQITKQQAAMLRKAFPDLSIKRTVSKYYIEESFRVTSFLRQLAQKGVNA